ncbi:MAG: T9SS type A sorting domain-containing protein [Ignavibacteria bacterium]|nr:T9SS type A sorting domain-containing protein [Ignavibacteria bacterium]
MKKTNRLFAAFAATVVLLMSSGLSYSAPDSKGTDFWLMFNGNLGTPTLTMFITSDVNTSGTVTPQGGAPIPFNVVANTVTPVSIPGSYANHTSDVIDNKGVHVVSNDEVTVYGLNYIAFTTDAYLGLPTDILGTSYVVLTYRNSNVVNAVQFGVVATQDNTTITITPSVTTGGRTAGVPYNIVMNQGETYELRNTGAAPNDLSGTTITSDKPIGVMGSHQCVNIPAGFVFCDHICEMLPPTTTWGRNFVTVPLRSRVNGDTWIIMASQNATVVTINGVPQAPINAGDRIETILTGQSIITANNPVLVAQYSNGSSFSGNPGDPFMMICPPYEQYLSGYTLTTVSGYVAHYINVVAPNAVVGSLTLDAVPVPVVEFTPIGASGFSGAQLAVTPGSHTLAATLPFGVFQYGFNNDDSYGYPGGLSLSPVAVVSGIDATPEFSINPINTQHCVDGFVYDQNNQPVTGIRVDFEQRGANPGAGFAFTGGNGVAQYCYTGTNAGLDTIIVSTGIFSDTVYKRWDGALPVELSSFTSTVTNRDVRLSWSTSEEINNSGFDIERSAVSGTWAKVGFVAGSGTTSEIRNYEFTDRNLASGKYQYRLKQIDYNGNFEYFNLSNEVEIGVPARFDLAQNYPNPFNPSTKINFSLPVDGNASLTVYDNSGRLVSNIASGFKSAGYYSVDFNAANLSSGVYFYKLEFTGSGQNFSKTMKMTVLK